jgi:hypothetical protein
MLPAVFIHPGVNIYKTFISFRNWWFDKISWRVPLKHVKVKHVRLQLNFLIFDIALAYFWIKKRFIKLIKHEPFPRLCWINYTNELTFEMGLNNFEAPGSEFATIYLYLYLTNEPSKQECLCLAGFPHHSNVWGSRWCLPKNRALESCFKWVGSNFTNKH